MVDVWPTVVAPLIEVLRPLAVLDLGDDGTAELLTQSLATWGGQLFSIADLDGELPAVDLALIHADANWWATTRALDSIAQVADAAQRPLPIIIVGDSGPPWGRRDSYDDPERVPAEARQPFERHGVTFVATDEGTPRNGVLTAIEDFVAGRDGLDVILVAGFGGTAILVDDRLPATAGPRLTEQLERLRMTPTAARLIEAVDERRRAARETSVQARAVRDPIAESEEHELTELRGRVRELAAQLALERAQRIGAEANLGVRASPVPVRPLAQRVNGVPRPGAPGLDREPGPATIRAVLQPGRLLEGLGWPGPEHELAMPIPVDLRGILEPGHANRLEVVAGADALAVRRTLCSILDRASEPAAVSIRLPDTPTEPVAELARTLALTEPSIALARAPAPEAERLVAGQELGWGWPRTAPTTLPTVAYLLPGIASEGSGGSHSVVQEVRGLRALGAAAHICVSAAALATAERLYGADGGLFRAYAGQDELATAVGEAETVVATEHTSVALLAGLARAVPERNYLYYVQDYEPLFAELGSPRSDRAVLSYRAVPGALLFAKTDWLRNVVAALHGVPVGKVEPSLDTDLYHPRGRDDRRAPMCLLAMLRPRTPRRRPGATLAALDLIGEGLGKRAELVTFGCETGELERAGLRLPPRVRHLGPLRREQVAEQLRHTDVFIDVSGYQAFGRTGLEAMACGAVPVLPRVGGVWEYARDRENAMVIENETPIAVADAVLELARDRELLHRLRATGVPTAARFTIERAAASQLALFTAAADIGGYRVSGSPART